ncbi:MAG: UDP-3-O-(3-hydroxymyristoyl)glucosamine N-acyltransferase [Verrucomicrobiota bacterium]
MNITVEQVAALVGGQVDGANDQAIITGVASIADAVEGSLTFFGNPRYIGALKTTRATAALVPLDFSEEIPAIKIKVANPSLAFAQLLEKTAPPPVVYPPGIHPTAVIGENVTLGDNVSVQPYAVIEMGVKIGAGTVIGAHAFIGQDATLGENCIISPNAIIRDRSLLGNRVMIQSGAVIGGDGFGYEFENGRYVKIPQIGIVQIDDDVEIGSNTTIDRARFGRTWIQEGTKIDNLVMIAHNVTVGKHSILVSQVGISGSTRLGNYVTLAGQVGLVGHIQIGDKVVVGAKSGVNKSISAGEMYFGIPALPGKEFKERIAYTNRLKKLFERVKKLEQVLGSDKNSLPPAT